MVISCILVSERTLSSKMKFKEIHFFVIGFAIGSSIVLIPFYCYNKQQMETQQLIMKRMSYHAFKEVSGGAYYDKYNETLSHILYEEVKVLCMVMTMPHNHRTKAIHIKNTWGWRCNKLVFVTTEKDSDFETIILPIKESRGALWNKTKASFKYLYDHYLEDYDWFLKADDDK